MSLSVFVQFQSTLNFPGNMHLSLISDILGISGCHKTMPLVSFLEALCLAERAFQKS